MNILAAAAIAVLQFVGRWVLRFVIRKGRRRGVQYMEDRIEVFLWKARKGRMPRFNKGRARRWQAALDWLKGLPWYKATRRAMRKLDKLIEKEIPEHVPQWDELPQVG